MAIITFLIIVLAVVASEQIYSGLENTYISDGLAREFYFTSTITSNYEKKLKFESENNICYMFDTNSFSSASCEEATLTELDMSEHKNITFSVQYPVDTDVNLKFYEIILTSEISNVFEGTGHEGETIKFQVDGATSHNMTGYSVSARTFVDYEGEDILSESYGPGNISLTILASDMEKVFGVGGEVEFFAEFEGDASFTYRIFEPAGFAVDNKTLDKGKTLNLSIYQNFQVYFFDWKVCENEESTVKLINSISGIDTEKYIENWDEFCVIYGNEYLLIYLDEDFSETITITFASEDKLMNPYIGTYSVEFEPYEPEVSSAFVLFPSIFAIILSMIILI